MYQYVSYFQSLGELNWRWPLVVGLHPSDFEKRDPQSEDPSYDFANIKTLSIEPVWANILLTRGVKKAIDLLSHNNWKFDTIIILDNKSNFEEWIDNPIEVDVLKSLVRSSDASAVFILPSEEELPVVLQGLLGKLADNNSLFEALDSYPHAFLYSDQEKIKKQTRLSYIVKRMIGELRISSRNKIRELITFPPFKVLRNTQEIINILEALKLHEDRGSSSYAFLIAHLYTQLSQYYMSGVFRNPDPLKRSYQPNIPNRPITISDLQDYHTSDKSSNPPMRDLAGKTGQTREQSHQTRFLQFFFRNEAQPGQPVSYLVYRQVSWLHVQIGYSKPGWSHPQEPIGTDAVFDKTSSDSEQIDIVFRPSNSPAIRNHIILPRYGDSTTTVFEFTSPDSYFFAGILEAYHQNKLLQAISFHVTVFQAIEDVVLPAHIDIKLLYNIGHEMYPLKDATRFSASYMVLDNNDNGKNKTGIAGMAENEVMPLYYSAELDTLMNEIRKTIERITSDADENPEKPPDFFSAITPSPLVELALTGNDLFVHHLNKKHLNGPLKIVTNRPGFAPLDFVYEFAPPSQDATICPHAKEALADGACKGCLDKSDTPAPHVCPLGFWGVRQIIARSAENEPSAKGDYLIKKVQPTENDRILQVLINPLHAFSGRVDNVLTTATQNVRDAIAKYSSQKGNEVKLWKEWQQIAQLENPDSMILIVHVENTGTGNRDQLEIGTDLLLQNYITTKYIKPAPCLRSPLMIVIGCKTSNIQKAGFDISSKLILEGAAVVISNYTKISGRNASAMVVELLNSLKESGDREMLFGDAILKTRQRLLQKGLVTGLSLVAYGDADWKFKTDKHV